MKGYLYAATLAALVGIIGWAAWSLYASGKAAGIAECQAERVEAAAKVQTAIDLRDQRTAEARTSMLDYLAAEKPAIEIRTHDTITKVRTIYRDRPIAGECIRPDGVSDALSEARDNANRAASGLRSSTHAPDTTHS